MGREPIMDDVALESIADGATEVRGRILHTEGIDKGSMSRKGRF